MTSENYFSWRSDLQAAFQAVTETVQITRIIEQQVTELAFDYYALFIRHPVPFTRPKTFIYTNYARRFIRHYMKENFSHIDPVLQVCQTPGKLVHWSEQSFNQHQGLHELITDSGIMSGFSYSAMAKNRAIGILSMSSGNGLENSGISLEKELKLQYLTDMTLGALMRIGDVSMMAFTLELSERELEILKWTAEGKTSAEISLILSISENTVNFHQKNMQKRLNAPNKTQIAAYAAAIGLI